MISACSSDFSRSNGDIDKKKSVFYSKEVWHELGEVYGLEVSIAFESGLGLDS